MSRDEPSLAIDPNLAGLAELLETGIAFNKHLGMRVDGLRPGSCILRIPFAPFLIGDPFRPAIHGGVLSALADMCGGGACLSLLTSGADRLSTVDMRIDYLRRGPPSDDLVCRASVLRMGNRVAVTQMDIFAGQLPGTDDGQAEAPSKTSTAEPIASGRGVYNVLRRND